MSLKDETRGRLQVVRLRELPDTTPFPCAPCFVGGPGQWLSTALKDSNVVAISLEHHRDGEADILPSPIFTSTALTSRRFADAGVSVRRETMVPWNLRRKRA